MNLAEFVINVTKTEGVLERLELVSTIDTGKYRYLWKKAMRFELK